jgi:hypothetical protein
MRGCVTMNNQIPMFIPNMMPNNNFDLFNKINMLEEKVKNLENKNIELERRVKNLENIKVMPLNNYTNDYDNFKNGYMV